MMHIFPLAYKIFEYLLKESMDYIASIVASPKGTITVMAPFYFKVEITEELKPKVVT
jgi:hypothetical protein